MSPMMDHYRPSRGYEADGLHDGYGRTYQGVSNRDAKPYIQCVEYEYRDDLSPSTSVHERSSVETYNSTDVSEEELGLEHEEELAQDHGYGFIPPLPSYHHEIAEPNVRASTPKDFAKLFPSMNRLSIRHDDFTSDGNMNLRVDTMAPGPRRTVVQLFHLRMYDLAKREFSLRRYSRDSGREVCSSKRTYVAPASLSRPSLQRSVSSAMKTLSGAAKPQFKRQNSSVSSVSNNKDKRPPTSHSYDTNIDVASLSSRTSSQQDHHKHSQPRPTNTMKLEFSNYARVDVERKGSGDNKRYEFEWWGHRYVWKRVAEKHRDDVVSFHLIRDGQPVPVAHIVPETRSPTQVEEDERAGGWVPPCHMWLNDKAVVEAVTDVADVIVSTGLMALVDDCIKARWQSKRLHRLPVLGDVEYVGPRAFMQRVFSQRRSSSESRHQATSSPLRFTSPLKVY